MHAGSGARPLDTGTNRTNLRLFTRPTVTMTRQCSESDDTADASSPQWRAAIHVHLLVVLCRVATSTARARHGPRGPPTPGEPRTPVGPSTPVGPCGPGLPCGPCAPAAPQIHATAPVGPVIVKFILLGQKQNVCSPQSPGTRAYTCVVSGFTRRSGAARARARSSQVCRECGRSRHLRARIVAAH